MIFFFFGKKIHFLPRKAITKFLDNSEKTQIAIHKQNTNMNLETHTR